MVKVLDAMDGLSRLSLKSLLPPRFKHLSNMLARIHSYIAALSPGKTVLWCYLTWYVAVVLLYFDSTPAIWLNSSGISAVVGFALLLSVNQTASTAPWQTARLFLMPFCVSSFSALIKGRGFFLIFPTNAHDLAIPSAMCALLLTAIIAIRVRAHNA